MTYTVTLTGNSSVLYANFMPPLELDDYYTIGLLSFETYNTIPNVKTNVNDMFYIGNISLRIPEGSYDIDSLESYLREQLSHQDPNIVLMLRGNSSTLKSEIRSNFVIYFNFPEKPNSIGPLLGFTRSNFLLEPSKRYVESNDIVQILDVNTISIQCNIASGSYINGEPDHSIHQFFPAVEPGYKIIETPNPVIYFPIKVRSIDNITVRVVDQKGDLISFRGETITLRVHLKKYGD